MNDHKEEAGANTFRREYAAALAQALRQAEEEQASSSSPASSTLDLADETYQNLCVDHPLVSAAGCRALATVLISPDHFYAPCDRLVKGISQLSERIQRQRDSPKPHNDSNKNQGQKQDDNDNDDDDYYFRNPCEKQHESLMRMIPSSSSPSSQDDNNTEAALCAYASLAWTVYGRIPLLCILSSRLEDAAKIMGSYRGDTSSLPQHKQQEEEWKDDVNQHPFHQNGKNDNVDSDSNDNIHGNDNNGDLAEVWATESDPSDYDFQEGAWNPTPEQQLAELDAWAQSISQMMIQPQQLSQAPDNTTWDDVAQAVTNLLRQLQFSSKLSALTMQEWRRLRVSEHLTQLVVTLLLPQAHASCPLLTNSRNVYQNNNNNNNIDDSSQQQQQQQQQHFWQQLALQPLFVMRDAVMVHTSSLLGDYLSLLQSLLQVENQLSSVSTLLSTSSPTKAPSKTSIAPAATWIALSSLSTLCANLMGTEHVKALGTTVVHVADDLCAILEKSHSIEELLQMLPWTFLPIFQILTSRPTAARQDGNCTVLGNPQAQILLNSGFFREWLVWWERYSTSAALRTVMEYNLLSLCCTVPTLLGKYAWRYPGFAAHVTDPVPKQEHGKENNNDNNKPDPSRYSQTLLWNLLGIKLAQQQTLGGMSTVVSRVQWKNQMATTQEQPKASPSVKECQIQAWGQYTSLCKGVANIISKWKLQREDVTQRKIIDDDEVRELEADLLLLEQFCDFSQSLTELAVLVPIFCFQMVLDESNDKNNNNNDPISNEMKRAAVRQSTVVIQTTLTTWKETPKQLVVAAKLKNDNEETEDDRPAGQRVVDRIQRQRPKLQDDAVTKLRKSVKMLQSAIDSCVVSTNVYGQARFSSKAD